MTKPWHSALFFAFAAGPLAAAETINIAFHNGTNTAKAMAAAVAPPTQGSVVNTSQESWNNIINNSGVGLLFTNLPLTNAAGVATPASLSCFSGFSGFNSTAWATQNKDWVMMEGWYGFKTNEFLSVSNLPAPFTSQGYSVTLYGDANTTRTMNYTIAGATQTINDATNFSGSFAAYTVVFSGLTNASFTLTGNPNAGDARSAVNGLRIVQNASATVAPSILSFAATPGRVTNGASVSLRWATLDATSLAVSPGPGDVTLQTTNGSGFVSVVATTTTMFTLTASNAVSGLVTSRTARVVVGPPVPNLLVFLVDDMGWQDTSVPFNHDTNGTPIISALNLRYHTPGMERLAVSGMKFTAAYSAPVCTPTRCAIMTGKNTARHRVTNWTTIDGTEPGGSNSADLKPPSGWLRDGLSSAETNTLPRLLAGAGYRTIHVGKGHVGSIGNYGQVPQNIGFDVNIAGSEIGNPASYYGTNNFGSGTHHVPGLEQYHGSNIFLTEALTLEMNKAIDVAASNGTPFFAYMAHYAVHTPWQNDPRFVTNYPGLTGNSLAFATLVEGMDQSLGDILTHLEQLGVAENTLVCFLTDNGGDLVNTPLRDKKGTLFEGGVRVPMIWSWAKTNSANAFQSALPIAAGSRQADSVQAWDLYPTLLGMAGLSYTNNVDGRDLAPYLRGEPGFHKPQQFVIHYPHNRSAQETPSTLYRDGDWKLIYDYQGGSNMLFHLASDPYETNDLAGTQPERLMQMTRDMARELDRLGAQYPERITNSAPVPPTMPNLPAIDLDADGIPDLGEDSNANGLIDAGETDAADPDTDNDTTPDGAELRIGTDPLNPASRFAALFAFSNGAPGVLTWPSRTGTLFRVEKSTSLLPAVWTTEADDIAGTSNATSRVTGAEPTNTLFYRILLK